jgi:hypothetical protein
VILFFAGFRVILTSMADPFAHLSTIAEEKIHEAIKNGEFENLPEKGKPLNFDEDLHLTLELRMACATFRSSILYNF